MVANDAVTRAGRTPVTARPWRIVRPLREGAAASWMRLFYDLLYELAFSAETIDDAAKIAIAHAHDTFRPEHVAIALLDGNTWDVFRSVRRDSSRRRCASTPPGSAATRRTSRATSSSFPSVAAFAKRFPRLQPLVERNIGSLVCAAFGMRVHRRGYLAFASEGEQDYSDDEFRLMALFALAAGIAFDRVAEKRA